MKKSLKISNKIIILSVVLFALFCLNAFVSPTLTKVSADDGASAYFYGDFIKVEGKTMRDYGITGWYTEQDPCDFNSDSETSGYFNYSRTYNVSGAEQYTINIYNLFHFSGEADKVTPDTTLSITTNNNLRFYLCYYEFYSDNVGDDYVTFITTNKVINFYDFLSEQYPDEVSEGDPELYPGTPEYGINFSNSNCFNIYYTHNLDDKEDEDAVFSNLCGFVIGQNGFISNYDKTISETDDGAYYYKVLDEYYTFHYKNELNKKFYLNFTPTKQTAGGFFLSDETVQVNNAGRMGQNYSFDYAQVNGYGKDKFNFIIGKADSQQLLSELWEGNHQLDDNMLDFNCIMLDYWGEGEIYALYHSSKILPFNQYTGYRMARIKNSNDFIYFSQEIGNKTYYNSFCCCFSPYVGEVKILSTNEPTQKFKAGKLANIVSSALWVAAFPVMLIGSIVNGITAATSGGDFFEGFRSWTKTIADGVADLGTNVSDFFEDLNGLLPGLPQPIKDLGKDPTTWVILLLIAVIVIIIVLFVKNRKNS